MASPGTGKEAPIATVQTPLRRVTIEQALTAMTRFPVRRAVVERVKSPHADGRVLAEDVRAALDVPGFSRSMVDGYAVVAADVAQATTGKPVRLTLAGEVLMGQAATVSVSRGQAVAVPTGGALPVGATGVVKIEDTALDGDHVSVFDGLESEDRITLAASDVQSGELLFTTGAVMRPASVGLLCAAGVADIAVYRPPAVGVLVTGDELVPVGRPLDAGQIHESNGSAIAAALRALGFTPHVYDLIPDIREALSQALRGALERCDAVVVSGGSSVGARDHVPAVVAAAGEPGVIVHGVRAKPGRPVLLAMIGDRLVLGLPGNPVSALVMLEALGRPILLRMFGIQDRPLPIRALLETAIETDPKLEHRIPVHLVYSAGAVRARPLIGSSSQLHILAFADAIVVVPEGESGIAAGTHVDAFPFSTMRSS
jgi:molybdopterin molybdotransferase